MKKLFRSTRILVGAILAPLLMIFGIGFALVGAVALGLGYLLTRWLPFTLFEATLLSTIFALIVLYLISKLESSPNAHVSTAKPDAAEEGWLEVYKHLPEHRFYNSPDARTWEKWLQAEIADDIYVAFQDEPHNVIHLDDLQRQELAIHLSEVALAIVKRKRGGHNRVTVSLAMLRRELAQRREQPYDEDIVRVAVDVVNTNLRFFAVPLSEVIRRQAWRERATIERQES